MRNLILLALLSLFGASSAFAQVPSAGRQVLYVTTDPTGSCGSAYITVNKTTKNVRVCTSGTWADSVTITSVPNAGVTGTTIKLLAEINASGNAVKAGTDVRVPAFIVAGGAGTTGSAALCSAGACTCTADASGITAGRVVVKSATAGRCADSGTTFWNSVIDPTGTASYPIGVAVTSCAANADCTVMR